MEKAAVDIQENVKMAGQSDGYVVRGCVLLSFVVLQNSLKLLN